MHSISPNINFIHSNTPHRPYHNAPHLQTRAAELVNKKNAVDDITINTITPPTKPSPTTTTTKSTHHHRNDSYDFFGNSRSTNLLKHKTKNNTTTTTNNTNAIKPSFRASPLLAEFQKQQQRSTTTRILFLDEGGEFRAILGAVLLKHMLSRLRTKLDVEVEWKSIGYPTQYGGPREKYIMDIMKSMELEEELMYNSSGGDTSSSCSDDDNSSISSSSSMRNTNNQRRRHHHNTTLHNINNNHFPSSSLVNNYTPHHDQQLLNNNNNKSNKNRKFNEVEDSVKYDLILVMDRFDYQEVIKEVSILDTINRGGNYTNKIRLLAPFGVNAKRATIAHVKQDIADPLYYLGSGDDMQTERSLLQSTAKELAFACRGVVTMLMNVHSGCRRGGGMTLRDGLGQMLMCPLLTGVVSSYHHHTTSSKSSNTTTTTTNNINNTIITRSTDDRFTIRAVNGQRKIVRRPSRHHSYWNNPHHIENELREWMKAHNSKDRLPSQKQLRLSGASSLASAIDKHGGLGVFAQRMGVSLASRRPNRYWEVFDNVSNALRPYLQRKEEGVDVVVVDNGGSDDDNDATTNDTTTTTTNDDDGVQSKQYTRITTVQLYLPTQQQLIDHGRSDLIRAIRYHGGSTIVAQRMGVRVRKDTAPYSRLLYNSSSNNTDNNSRVAMSLMLIDRAANELHQWISSSNNSNNINATTDKSSLIQRAPTHAELVAAHRNDLWILIQRCGGMKRVAAYMGLPWMETRGRKKRRSSTNDSTTNSDSSSDNGIDPGEEIDLLDAYEEFVFI